MTIDLDVDSWIDCDGVVSTVWMGETDDPTVQVRTLWYDLVDKEIESYTVHGKIAEVHMGEAKEFIRSLQEVAQYAQKRLEELSDEVKSD